MTLIATVMDHDSDCTNVVAAGTLVFGPGCNPRFVEAARRSFLSGEPTLIVALDGTRSGQRVKAIATITGADTKTTAVFSSDFVKIDEWNKHLALPPELDDLKQTGRGHKYFDGSHVYNGDLEPQARAWLAKLRKEAT